MSTPRRPDLDQLIAALTADGRPEELAGRDAACASFHHERQRGMAAKAATRRRWPLPPRARLAAVGAAVVVAAGVAAAAYTQALPGPAQRLAHTALAPLGVPDGQQHPGQRASITIASSASPRPGNGYRVNIAVSRARVPANATVAFTGRVTDRGGAAAHVRVRLFERVADSTTEELVATGVTGPRGGFRLITPPLRVTGVFRVVGPDAAHSTAIRVAVAARS